MYTKYAHGMSSKGYIMLDYGPVHGYWCFSFKRYNGMLEAMNKSWLNPDKQLLSKFMDLQLVNRIDVSAKQTEDFLSLVISDITIINKMSIARSSGSVHLMGYEHLDLTQQLTSHFGATHLIIIIIIISHASIGADVKKRKEKKVNKSRADQWLTGLFPFANRGLTGSWTSHWTAHRVR